MRSARSFHRARLSGREALLFEAGIKLGGIFHQYLGIPVSRRTSRALSRSVEAAVGLQPFVTRVRVTIDPSRGGRLGRPPFDYRYLTAEMLSAKVELSDGPWKVVARLGYRADLRYPLMRVERLSVLERDRPSAGRRSARREGRSGRRTSPSAG